MAKAKKLASGNYSCQVYIGRDKNGKRKYRRFTDKSKRGAELKAAEYVATHRQYCDQEHIVFSVALDAYIESKTPVLSPSTIRGYRFQQKQLLKKYPHFCSLELENIDRKELQRLINDFVRSGLSPKTIRNRHAIITAVFKDNEVEPPHVTLPEKQRHEPVMPTEKQLRELLDTVEGTEVEIPIRLAMFGGLRRGEVIALSPEDINGNVIHVKAGIVQDENGALQRKTPKNYTSDRYVTVPEELAQSIIRKGCVTHFRTPHAITSAFERATKKVAGLEGLRFHDLRHWHASYLHSLGVPDIEIMKRGGWSSDNVMKRVYRHCISESEEANTQRIMQSFSSFF